jgi:hypothetical protein
LSLSLSFPLLSTHTGHALIRGTLSPIPRRGQDLGQPVKRLLGDTPSPTPPPLAAAAAANALNASTSGDAVGNMEHQVSEGRRQHVSEGRRQHVSEFFRSTDEDDGFHRHVLHLRDLHCLKPGTEPIIHVRLDAIVVNLPPIQGVITVFYTPRSLGFGMYGLGSRFERSSGTGRYDGIPSPPRSFRAYRSSDTGHYHGISQTLNAEPPIFCRHKAAYFSKPLTLSLKP